MADLKDIFKNQGEKYHQFVSREDYKNNLITTLLSIDDLTGKDVIEFGAGTGRMSFKLCDYTASITAFEKSPGMLKVAERLKNERGITNIEFKQADSLLLSKHEKEYDAAIQGWSFLAVISFSEKRWEKDNCISIMKTLINNMKKAVKKGGYMILIESLGTFKEEPDPPGVFIPVFDFLENGLHFSRKAIRTDYKFENVEQAHDLMTFFFGEEAKEYISKDRSTIIPECTGIWYKKNDKIML